MKTAYFYIDDVIWLFRDLTRQRPASMFDYFFLKELKKAHELYGAKFQLNVFYRTSFCQDKVEFTLAEMTDAYKAEWEAASDWLKFGVHAWEEFPDWPFEHATYEDTLNLMQTVKGQLRRFAGENSFSETMTPHWGPATLEACRAFRDGGVRLLYATSPSSPLWRNNHNNLSEEEAEASRFSAWQPLDPATGLYLKRFGSMGKAVNNAASVAEIDELLIPCLDREYLTVATHCQYSYPDYKWYQPDHWDKILRVCQLLHESGYTFIYAHELIRQ